LIGDEIQRRLARPPAIDKAIYCRWAINYWAAIALQTFKAPPKPNHEAAALLENTRYDDPSSVCRLSLEINSTAGIARLPLGNYAVGRRKVFCYLHFSDTLLPRDPPRYGPEGESDMTYLKCEPDLKALPKSVYQIGQLCLSSTTNPASARPSCFVVAVTPTCEVFATWNPIGPDPEYVHDDEVLSTGYKTRLTGGQVLGFKDPCTAFMLADTIDSLCQPHQGSKALAISEKNFITLPAGSTLRFTGVAIA
jgi:hypothetical protein